MTDGAVSRTRTPLPPVGHVVAAAILVAAVAVAWGALSFVPGLSDRLGTGPGVQRIAEGRAAVLTYAAVFGGALLIALAARQRVGFGRRAMWLAGTAFPLAALAVAGALAISWAAGVTRLADAPAPGAATLLVGWLLYGWAALGEEILFRGVLQPVLARAWGTAAALGLTALAFALVHYLGGWRDPVTLLNIFVAALWFGLLALRTGGILAPWLAHAGWNGVEALVFGASPNPGTGPFGSILDVDIAGAALLGGSGDGLNASLGTTVVLVALIAPLAMRVRIGDEGKRA